MKFYRPVAVASYRKLVGYQAGLLAGICALVAALILIGNTVTSERIEAMEKADQLKMLSEVLPSNIYDNDLLADQLHLSLSSKKSSESNTDKTVAKEVNEEPVKPLMVYLAKSNDKISGMAFPVTANGYGGDINMIVGVDVNGTILGVRVINHKETPGLGDKIEISRDQWITSFDGLSLANTPAQSWGVKKDGGQFDQFTGATITPRAIVRAVYQGLLLIKQQQHAINDAAKKQLPLSSSLAMVENKINQPNQPKSTNKIASQDQESHKANVIEVAKSDE